LAFPYSSPRIVSGIKRLGILESKNSQRHLPKVSLYNHMSISPPQTCVAVSPFQGKRIVHISRFVSFLAKKWLQAITVYFPKIMSSYANKTEKKVSLSCRKNQNKTKNGFLKDNRSTKKNCERPYKKRQHVVFIEKTVSGRSPSTAG
jgi:hypothetical protein